MSGFSSLNIAVTGLNAAQRAVDITSQNISNVNTPGYSRQRIIQSSVATTPEAHFYTGGGETLFGGTKIDGVERIHDAFLEAARVNASASRENLGIRASTLSGVEDLFNEPSDNGLQASLDDFYADWHALGQNVTDESAGTAVLRAADSTVTLLRSTADNIDEAWANTYGELQDAVTQLNATSVSLAGINREIINASANDRPVNELLDRRDTLVRTLGDLAGGRAVQSSDGTVSVLLNGVSVVAGGTALPVTLTGGSVLADVATNPPKLMVGTVPVPVADGRTAGLLASLNTDIPTVSAQLDAVAVSLRDAVNSVHSSGYTLDGRTGLDFFSGTSARDLTVAAGSIADLAVANAPNVVDGTNAQKIADLAQDANAKAALGGSPGPSERLRILAGDLGTKLQGLNRAADVQETVFAAADSAVNSDSGVSVDEEMTNLLMYQRSYQANARVITTIDSMLDTLINRTAA